MTNVTQPLGIDSFEIVGKGVVSIHKPAASLGVDSTINHNLGYVPAVICFLGTGGSIFLPIPTVTSTSAGLMQSSYDYFATTTQITFRVSTGNVAGGAYNSVIDADFTYYLLRETAN